MHVVEEMTRALRPEPIEVNLFRGITPASNGNPQRIFGGQVIAQALMAGYATVEGRLCHSLHAYFIRPGDPSAPVLYQVERARDGSSFTTRRVTAIQHGEQILNLAASFQVNEKGFEHQAEMPKVPGPEGLGDNFDRFKFLAERFPERFAEEMKARPVEIRPVDPQSFETPRTMRAGQEVWFRVPGEVGADAALNQGWLAYVSDWSLMEACMRPHAVTWFTPGMQAASLDHAIWFHRPSNMSDWHLYVQDSPSASGARGFIRGDIFTREGVLVASVAQEALIRLRKT